MRNPEKHLLFGTDSLPPGAGRQRGVTLLEMMVGITIGLLVVLAALGTIVLTRQSGSTIADTTQLTSQATNALRTIGAQIRQAGAIETLPSIPTAAAGEQTFVFSPVYDGLDLPGGNVRWDGPLTAAGLQTTVSVFGTEGGAAADTLNVSYQDLGANVTRDCIGNAAPAAAANIRIENFFSLNGTTFQCAGGAAPTAPQPIADDVEDFQVNYIVETLAGGQPVHQLLNATGVAGLWSQVVGVEICLQVRGQRTDYPTAGTFVDCRGGNTAHGGRIHKVFRNTYFLRNLGQ